MPQDLLLRGAIARLKEFEQSGSGEEQECVRKILPARYCVRVIREFIYESDLDKNGVLHYLGTQVGLQLFDSRVQSGWCRRELLSTPTLPSLILCLSKVAKCATVTFKTWLAEWVLMFGLMTTQMKPGEQSESSVVSDGFDFRYEIDLGSRHCVQVNAYTLRRCEQS